MVEHQGERNLSCRLCLDGEQKNLSIAHCLGCREIFCIEHLIEHRRRLTEEINQLIKRNEKIKLKTLDEQLQFVERWEYQMIEWIHRHTDDVKEKISDVYHGYHSEWKERNQMMEIELQNKRDSSRFFERDLTHLSEQIERLEKEILQQDKLLHQITINELNQIIPKYQPLTTIGKKANKLISKRRSFHFD